MYIYHFDNNGECKLVLTDFANINYPKRVASSLDIPLVNCVELDGQLYDNREIDYWKALKTKENQTSAYMKSIAGLTVNGIKVKTTAESATALNELLSLATLENDAKAPVEFRDYNDEWHSVTVEQFRTICLQVGQYCRAIDKSYTTNINLIEQAKTIEEVQAIVI